MPTRNPKAPDLSLLSESVRKVSRASTEDGIVLPHRQSSTPMGDSFLNREVLGGDLRLCRRITDAIDQPSSNHWSKGRNKNEKNKRENCSDDGPSCPPKRQPGYRY